jgi:hypothetical protein
MDKLDVDYFVEENTGCLLMGLLYKFMVNLSEYFS